MPTAVATYARRRGYLTRGDCPGGVAPVGKIVLAAGGDTVNFGPQGVVIGGQRVDRTRPLDRDSRGRRLVPARFGSYVLRTGEAWLWSPYAAGSFDSRYFGPVGRRELVSTIQPVLTVGDWTETRLLP